MDLEDLKRKLSDREKLDIMLENTILAAASTNALASIVISQLSIGKPEMGRGLQVQYEAILNAQRSHLIDGLRQVYGDLPPDTK